MLGQKPPAILILSSVRHNFFPHLFRLLTLLLSLACLSPLPGRAQSGSAVLVGTLNRRSDLPVANAQIELSSKGLPSLRFAASTDSAGRFAFLAIPPGSYELTIVEGGKSVPVVVTVEVPEGSIVEATITLPLPSASPGRRNPSLRIERREATWGMHFAGGTLRTFPNSGNVWSLLESQDPSTVTNRLDVGGLRTGEPALFGALGASWTENQYRLGGLNVTDPYIPGQPLIDPDLGAVEELRTVSGAKPADQTGSGLNLDLVIPMTSATTHGTAQLFYTGDKLQSDGLSARLRRIQFPGPELFNHLVDGRLQLGGALPARGRSWPFFAALSTQQLSKRLGGFAAPIDAHIYRALVELTPVSRGMSRLNLVYSGQHVFRSHEDADPRVAPSATTRGNDNFHQFRVHGERGLGSKSWLAAGFGVVNAIVASGLQGGLTQPSTIDLPALTLSGAAPYSLAGVRTRYQGDATARALRDGPLGSHAASMGFEWDRSQISNRWDSLGGIEQTLVNGVGNEVTRWNTSASAREHVQNLAFFAQDAWRPLRWLSLPLGLRLESSSGGAAGAANGIRWTTLEPRAAMVMRLGSRGAVLRATWARYGHLLQGRYFDFGNPSALGGEVFRWSDSNGDGPAQGGELSTLLRVLGGPHSALDRGLTRPFTDEVSIGLDQDFGSNFRAGVRFFRRDSHRLIALANPGVPASSYTPVQVLDPGNDGIAGTSDDQVLTLYNRNPSALGQDFLLLTNPPGDHASFKGFEIRLAKQLMRVWEFSASFTAMQTLAPTSPGNTVFENDTGFVGSLGIDPNTFIYSTSRTYFDRAFIGKATGYYFAPRGFQVGFVAKYYDGLPFGRLLFVDGFNQGPFFVRATPRAHPGGFQTQFNMTLDVRVAKEFELRRGKLSGYLDLFNALNLDKNTLEADLTGPTFQSRVPLAVQAPRVTRLGVEWRF